MAVDHHRLVFVKTDQNARPEVCRFDVLVYMGKVFWWELFATGQCFAAACMYLVEAREVSISVADFLSPVF